MESKYIRENSLFEMPALLEANGADWHLQTAEKAEIFYEQLLYLNNLATESFLLHKIQPEYMRKQKARFLEQVSLHFQLCILSYNDLSLINKP